MATAVSKGRNHLRDASFSSYLDTADTDFVRSLAASMHESSPIFTPSRQSSSSSMSKRRTRGPLGELSVFGAEGYFGDKMDHHDRTPSFRSVEDRVPQTKHKSKPRTPSIRSESSWSSKSIRNTDQIKPKKSVGGPWFLAGLQCKGSCYDVKPPVYTKRQSSTTSTNLRKGFWEDQVVQINSKKQPFHQPRLNTVLAKQPERTVPSFAFPKTQEEDTRKSIEVFGLNTKTQKEDEDDEEGGGGGMSFIMEKKLSMLSWDAIPAQAQHKRRSSGSCRYDEMESDASSDLFDIAVFPAEMSPVTAPYEPSEASIEWSVVTASAAEFSAVPDLDEEKQIGTKKKTLFKPKELQSGGIMGCKNDKAVNVVNPANSTARKASFPPIPPKNSSFASKAANTCPSSSARTPRSIYMY